MLLLLLAPLSPVPLLAGSGFQTAAFVADDTWLYARGTVRPSATQLAALAVLSRAFTSQPGFDQAMEELQRGQMPDATLDFQRDVWPLLGGEIGVAVRGPQESPSLLLFIQSSDPLALLRLLARAEPSLEPTEEYRGAAISADTNAPRFGDGDELKAGAAFGEWVVLGQGTDEVKAALDRMRAGPSGSLAESSRFQQVMARLPADHLAAVYWDTSTLVPAWLEGLDGDEMSEAARNLVQQGAGRGALALLAEPESLTLVAEAIPDQPMPAPASGGDALYALELLPDDTLFALAGSDASTALAGVEALLNQALEQGTLPDQPRPQLHFTRWMQGAFGIGLGPGTLHRAEDVIGGDAEGAPDAYFIAQVGDPALAEQDLAQLDPLVQPLPVVLAGREFRQVPTSSASDPRVVYGLAGQWFVAGWGQVERLLQGDKAGGLGANPRYQSLRAGLDAGQMVVFWDMEATWRLVDALAPPRELADGRFAWANVRPAITPLRALSGSWRMDRQGDGHARLTLLIRG